MNESPQVEEPLEESAPLAWRLAPELCRKDPVTGESCAWEHGPWQCLRLLGLVTSPSLHAEFYREALASLPVQAHAPRVLVSGAADYAMLAVARRAEVACVVVDRCETPLALNRWYAERMGFNLVAHRSDILDFTASPPFDAACTHAFLSYFAQERRSALIAKWRDLLRPGGRLVTVNRLRPREQNAQSGFAPEQVTAYREKVLLEALRMRDRLPAPPEAIADAAERFARKQRSFPVRSLDEIRALFEAGGFRIEHLGRSALPGPQQSPVTGPSVPGSADYAFVIAIRR